MREVEHSQRNIVFPDTAENEARFWRNIISGKEHLSVVQIIGIVLICGLFSGAAWDLLRAMTSIRGWLFLLGCGAAFLLLRWRVRKADTGAPKRPPLAK